MGHNKRNIAETLKKIKVVAKTYFICMKCKLNRPNKIKKSQDLQYLKCYHRLIAH